MKTHLPPLRVLPGQTIIERLAAEHISLTRMCAQLRLEPSREGGSILCATMGRHLSAERQFLYPAALKALGSHTETGRLETDRLGTAVTAMLETDRQLLSDLDILLWSPPASELWDEALTRTDSYLREHIRDCATELLVPLRARLSEVELKRMGNRFEFAEQTAPSRPYPHSPVPA